MERSIVSQAQDRFLVSDIGWSVATVTVFYGLRYGKVAIVSPSGSLSILRGPNVRRGCVGSVAAGRIGAIVGRVSIVLDDGCDMYRSPDNL